MAGYDEVYRRSLEDPEGFWGEAAGLIDWVREPERILDDSKAPFYRWFVGGELNTCHNALDRHVDGGRADQLALVYDSPVTGRLQAFTYRELRDAVARFAGVLRGLGVGKGDRVVIYMPMVPEAAMAMLACARLGAIHSVVFGGFASHELAIRIDDARPKVVISASCGIEVTRVIEYKPLLDRAIEMASHKPEHCVILQRDRAEAKLVESRDLDWSELMETAQPAECVPVAATDLTQRERAHREHHDVGPRCPVEAEGRRHRLGRPPSGQEEHRGIGHPPQDERQRALRRWIEPLEVVDGDDQRAPFRLRPKQAERGSRYRELVPRPIGSNRLQDLPLPGGERLERRRQRLEQIHQGDEGQRRLVLGRLRDEGSKASFARQANAFLPDRGLADPRLAVHHDRGGGARGNPVEEHRDLREFAPTADDALLHGSQSTFGPERREGLGRGSEANLERAGQEQPSGGDGLKPCPSPASERSLEPIVLTAVGGVLSRPGAVFGAFRGPTRL